MFSFLFGDVYKNNLRSSWMFWVRNFVQERSGYWIDKLPELQEYTSLF